MVGEGIGLELKKDNAVSYKIRAEGTGLTIKNEKVNYEINGKDLTTTEIKERLSNYLIYGGYPESNIKKLDVKEYLLTLFNSIIYFKALGDGTL